MREERVLVATAQEQSSGQDLTGAVRTTCKTLANTLALKRIELGLERKTGPDETMTLIRLARDIAREWGLDSYVRFRADDLRITFVKRPSP